MVDRPQIGNLVTPKRGVIRPGGGYMPSRARTSKPHIRACRILNRERPYYASVPLFHGNDCGIVLEHAKKGNTRLVRSLWNGELMLWTLANDLEVLEES